MRMLAACALAAAIVAAMPGASVAGQDWSRASGAAGPSMLELGVRRQLRRIGIIDADMSRLSTHQLASIHLILSSDDDHEGDQRAQIDAVLSGRSRTIR